MLLLSARADDAIDAAGTDEAGQGLLRGAVQGAFVSEEGEKELSLDAEEVAEVPVSTWKGWPGIANGELTILLCGHEV